ncbi:MAG: radical SAM protein [Candidatus Bathyarchaeia archaeon]
MNTVSTFKTEREKRRIAAKKAWESIRRKRRIKKVEEAKSLIKIDLFIQPSQIAKIKHPEDISPLTPQKFSRKIYSEKIIRPFSKVPPDIVCGMFWELRWAFGCPLNCAYCYLRGTYKGKISPPRYIRIDHVLKALDEIFNDNKFNQGRPAIINSGELADSLMNPTLIEKVADKFEEQNKHKLLILTKFGTKNAAPLLKKARKQTICAWSLNAPKVARLWERNAPAIDDRIEAAKLAKESGYTVWIRIDPIFPIEDWQDHYEHLLLKIFHKLIPDRIILGTPRGLWKTLLYARKAGIDTSWIKFFRSGEKTGWGLKLPFEIRKEIYVFMWEKLKELGYDTVKKLSICKETIRMWRSLNWTYYPGECQCYGSYLLEQK